MNQWFANDSTNESGGVSTNPSATIRRYNRFRRFTSLQLYRFLPIYQFAPMQPVPFYHFYHFGGPTGFPMSSFENSVYLHPANQPVNQSTYRATTHSPHQCLRRSANQSLIERNKTPMRQSTMQATRRSTNSSRNGSPYLSMFQSSHQGAH